METGADSFYEEAAAHLPPESAYFLAVNRNKRSITVDFKKPAGLAVLHRMNFIPGKLASMGLGWEDCRKLNARLVYASISECCMGQYGDGEEGYGQTGPYREAAGYDVVIEGEAGLMHMYVYRRGGTGEAGGDEGGLDEGWLSGRHGCRT
ncbi:CoA-transferase family III [Auriscalpium vulgare]|uniref:CoA-transferase family III n=1 Tax=Auriscalpium vulgare TaxID=40419 RepID=A0ACB8S4J6_9AGAM|nr:CoA-transferase family III [Auriscalpium vulgare]